MFGITGCTNTRTLPLSTEVCVGAPAAGKKVLRGASGPRQRKIAEDPGDARAAAAPDGLRSAVDSGADIIGITSFNEWPESTVVAPA